MKKGKEVCLSVHTKHILNILKSIHEGHTKLAALKHLSSRVDGVKELMHLPITIHM
jgi:hypothetical protein